MKTKNLKNIVKAINKVVGKNSVVPIIDNVLIKDGRIFFTDLEVFVSVAIPNDSLNSQVPYCLLAGEFKSLVSDFEDVSVVESNDKEVKLVADGAKIKYNPDKWDDFPKMPHITIMEEFFKATEQDVEYMVDALKYISVDPFRPAMKQLAMLENHIVSTDAHKLYFNPSSTPFNGTHLIRPKAVEVMNVFGGGWQMDIADDKYIQITNGDVVIVFKEMDEKYPDVFAIIPEKNPISVEVCSYELIKTLKQSLKFANQTTHQIRVNVNGAFNISSEDLDFGKSYSKDVSGPYRHKGNDIVIGFNAKYLLEIINNIDTDVTLIEMSEPNKCVIINKKLLLMPVMLNV